MDKKDNNRFTDCWLASYDKLGKMQLANLNLSDNVDDINDASFCK